MSLERLEPNAIEIAGAVPNSMKLGSAFCLGYPIKGAMQFQQRNPDFDVWQCGVNGMISETC